MNPAASIIIPTQRGRAHLARTLEALGRQTISAATLEIIVVVDGGDDATVRMVEDLAHRGTLRVLAVSRGGAGPARNAGAREARAKVLIFLDDDMEALPGLVEAHLRAQRRCPGSLVLGSFHTPGRNGSEDLQQLATCLWWEDGLEERSRPGHHFTFRDLWAGNFSLDADTFAQHGGFDHRFRDKSGEDYELGVRLLRAGVRFRHEPSAATIHHDLPDQMRAFARARCDGRGHVVMMEAHPQLTSEWPLSASPRGPFLSLLVALGWHAPRVTDAVARALHLPLHAARWLKLRRLWGELHSTLHGYHYWKGVRDEIGTAARLRAQLQDAAAAGSPERIVRLDLPADPERIDSVLESAGAAVVQVAVRGRLVGVISGHRSGGALRGDYVRRVLAQRFAEELVDATGDDAPGAALLKRIPRAEEAPVLAADERWARAIARGEVPMLMCEWDVRAGPPEERPIPQDYSGIEMLVRDGRRPLGTVRVHTRPGQHVVTSAEITQEAERQLGSRIALSASLSDWSELPPITVVVCTRDRPVSLARCLRALCALDYPTFEVVVVDSASGNDRPAAVVATTPFRYVRENAPGLGRARNRGIAAASYGIIAFTDDDAVVDPGWLRGVADALSDPRAAAVTGLVLPFELETRAQHLFEMYGGMGKGFEPVDHHRDRLGASGCVPIHHVGAGANMAFRRSVLDAVGGFHPSLGAGTTSMGAEDLEIFHRVVASGFTLRYHPAALVRHQHRREMSDLRAQLYANGRAFGVYLLEVWRMRYVPAGDVLRFTVRGWLPWLVGRAWRRLRGREPLPLTLILAEMLGALRAPLAWLATPRRPQPVRERAQNESTQLAPANDSRALTPR